MTTGLASGFPLAALAASSSLTDAQPPGSMGGTYAGNAVSCAAAVATQRVIREEGPVGPDAEDLPQISPDLPQISPDLPQICPRSPQISPRSPQISPRSPPDAGDAPARHPTRRRCEGDLGRSGGGSNSGVDARSAALDSLLGYSLCACSYSRVSRLRRLVENAAAQAPLASLEGEAVFMTPTPYALFTQGLSPQSREGSRGRLQCVQRGGVS